MNSILTSVSGWLLIILLVITVLYPFALRKGLLGPVQPFLRRMRLHYWLGYSLVVVLCVHIFESMTAQLMNATDAFGLNVAMIAALVIFIQVVLGFNLSQPKYAFRRVTRRWHFWLMVAIVVLVSGHVILNSSAIHLLVLREI